MRSFLSIFFAFYYLLASLGIVINVHYCQGKVEAVKVYTAAKQCCCGDGMDAGCCSDESFVFQLEEEQPVPQPVRWLGTSTPAILPFPTDRTIGKNDVQSSPLISNYGLPPPKGPPLWLRHCALIYYG